MKNVYCSEFWKSIYDEVMNACFTFIIVTNIKRISNDCIKVNVWSIVWWSIHSKIRPELRLKLYFKKYSERKVSQCIHSHKKRKEGRFLWLWCIFALRTAFLSNTSRSSRLRMFFTIGEHLSLATFIMWILQVKSF